MGELGEITDMAVLMRRWEDESGREGWDPVPILTRMAELVEAEIFTFVKMDPDPFDERHPSRADPSCMLGHLLKIVFKKDNFMDKLVNEYLRDNYWTRQGQPERDSTPVNVAACRLVLDVMPGLETSAVFQTPEADPLILRLFSWAEKASDPLRSYAIGLLAAAMEIQDTAAVFREHNTRFVPLMLTRLREMQEEMAQQRAQQRPFAHLNQDGTPTKNKGLRRSSANSPRRKMSPPPGLMSPPSIDVTPEEKTTRANGVIQRHRIAEDGEHSLNVSDCSNSSWAEMESYVIATAAVYPLTLACKQILILRYLAPMGEYQEFLSYIFEHNALSLILHYTNIRETRETRLGFEALKYLAALLCHKKVSIEFIAMGGLKRLLEVPRPSVAATGVSICFYYLAYCEDAMEKICLSPKYVVSELVSYALWLIECSHNSGRCHATMFFGLSFQFRTILDEFDAQDGLRKMYNVVSTLPIVRTDEGATMLNEDEECSYRQIVRHVTVALKRYYEAHLAFKVEQTTRLRTDRSSRRQWPPYRARKSLPEDVQSQVETLMEVMPLHAPWPPVDNFHSLGGISLLLQIIALAYEWNFSGRAETVQSALAVLSICCIRPAVQLTFCERLKLPDDTMSVGMNIILGSCEGEVVPDPEVQKTALQVIINCVCAPIERSGSHTVLKPSEAGPAKRRIRSGEELIQKVWGSVRENNGIIVLLMLMMIKTPITDADALRALACRALAGLARCDKVRQIVSKLPFFTDGSIQVVLKEPILAEKRVEHVQFQKYYLELIEHIMGDNRKKSQPQTATQDLSLTNIHRANVVAQTCITYNKQQLYQLIHQQLVQDGLMEAAAALVKQANLAIPKTPPPLPYPPNRHTVKRGSQTKIVECNTPKSSSQPTTPTSPIKLNLTRRERGPPGSCNSPATPNRSLQKQTSWDASGVGCLPRPPPPPVGQFPPPPVSLHSIVTEYLTNQHALCKNPMVTCPQFNLFVPHKCPEPRSTRSPMNFTMRYLKRQTGFHVPHSPDVWLTHSRFYPERTIRLNPDDGVFMCCAFVPNSPYLAVGTSHGELRLYSSTETEEALYQCHESFLSNIECNRSGTLFLTSAATWRRPLSALWTMDSLFDMKLSLNDEEYAEFSKTTEDKIVGTKHTAATIYDIEKGEAIIKLKPVLSNAYSKNRATFNPTDELILTDGVLFDVRSGQEIHKFDKLNSVLSGVFHPNGLEVLSNTEVWDLRTFHLLQTVPALELQQIKFSPMFSIIYTCSFEQDQDERMHESSFKTLDSRNYASIATIDTKKEIYSLACNKFDTRLAVVENTGENRDVQETTVKIYAVGRRRDQDDEAEEEEEEEDETELDSDTGSDGETRPDIVDMVADALRAAANGDEDGGGGGSDSDETFELSNSEEGDDDDDDDDFDLSNPSSSRSDSSMDVDD